MARERTVDGWVTLAAAVLTAGTIVLPPVLWILLSYQRMVGSLEAEAEVGARNVTQVISADPDLWEYEHTRLGELLQRRPGDGVRERRTIRNGRGEIVAESADPVPPPRVLRALPLLDAGTPVGTFEISRSLRPLLARAGLLALVLLPIGTFAFVALRRVPLRALRRSEAALRRERDTARRYLDAAGVAFVLLDGDGRVARVNRMGTELLGRAETDLIGREWLADLVPPADRERAGAMLAAAPGGDPPLEYAILRPGGDRRIVAWHAAPLGDARGDRSRLLSGVDVTRRRQLEEELRQTSRLRAIGQLAGGVAHDFNEILADIRGHAAVLRADLDLVNPHRLDADEILAATDRAASLTNGLLTFSRRQAMTPEPVDLADVVRRSERRLRRLLREGIALDLVLAPEPLPALADPGQIEQVLVNLVANAQDAIAGAGRIVVSAAPATLDGGEARRAGLTAPGGYARLAVVDDGAGIDAEHRARAFEPFFTTKEPGKGTGLGLAMAFGIVELHGGTIRIASEPGRGTTVTFLLPLRGAASDPA